MVFIFSPFMVATTSTRSATPLLFIFRPITSSIWKIPAGFSMVTCIDTGFSVPLYDLDAFYCLSREGVDIIFPGKIWDPATSLSHIGAISDGNGACLDTKQAHIIGGIESVKNLTLNPVGKTQDHHDRPVKKPLKRIHGK